MISASKMAVVPPSGSNQGSITVGITRLLNTAQYESLQVTLSSTEDITWTSAEERSGKITQLVSNLNAEYIKTQSQVLAELGVTEKRAWMKQPTKTSVSEGRSGGKTYDGDDLLG